MSTGIFHFSRKIGEIGLNVSIFEKKPTTWFKPLERFNTKKILIVFQTPLQNFFGFLKWFDANIL